MGDTVPGRPASGGEIAELSAKPAESGRSAQPDNLSESKPSRAPERDRRVPGDRIDQSGQSDGTAVDSGNQSGDVAGRASQEIDSSGQSEVKRGSKVQWEAGGRKRQGTVNSVKDGSALIDDGTGYTEAVPTSRLRLAQRRGAAEFTGRYTVRDLATNATAEYRPARNRPGVIYLNEWGHALVRDTLVDTFGETVANIPGDFTLDVESLRRVAGAARKRAEGVFAEIADKLDLAANDASANGRDVAIVTARSGQSLGEIKQAVRHETIHTAQSAIDSALTGAATLEWLSRQPKAGQIKAELARRGYDSSTHGFEAVAYIASGDFATLGLTLNEAVRLMDSYYRATVRKYGASALGKFGAIDPKLQPVLEGARSEAETTASNSGGSTKRTGESDRGAEREAGHDRRGAEDSLSEGRGRTKGVPQVAERKERRFQSSFGEIDDSSGTVLGSAFGVLQGRRTQPTPKTTPLREIAAEHKPIVVDPFKLQDMTMDAIWERQAAGTLPGARALLWADRLKLKGASNRIVKRQVKFINDTMALTNDLVKADKVMRTSERGSREYEKAKRDFNDARLKIANALSKASEYTPISGYLARAYKSSLLSAPHIHLFNMLEQLFKMPLHYGQRLADAVVPISILRKYGIEYEKSVTDFRDMVPAIEADLRGLWHGLKESPRDIMDMFRYGVTQQMLTAEDADAESKGGSDKFELGTRAKLIPGLDQVLNFIGRSHGAADIPFSNMVNATAIAAQASAIARKIGKAKSLSREEIKSLAVDLAHEPSALMRVLADDATMRFKLDYPTMAYDLFQKVRDLVGDRLGKASEKGVGKFADATWKAAMDFIVPFSKIPLAAVDTYLFRYSPVAFGRVAGRMAMAKGGEHTGRYKGEFAKQRFGEDTAELLRQGLVGSLSWALLGALGSFGYLAFTGGGEDDKDRPNVKNVREALRVAYGPEVRAGDYALNLNRMGPLGQAAGIATRIHEAQKPRTDPKTGEPEETDKRIARTASAAEDALFFNNPLGQAAKDLAGDDAHSTSAGQYVAGKLRGLVPGLARDIAKIQSPTKRVAEESSTLGRLKGDLQSGMPIDVGFGSREQMAERLDSLGRPIEEQNPFTFWRKVPRDKQLEEMERLGVGFSKPKREKGEAASEYNRKITGSADSATGEQVPGSADKLQAALRRISEDARWSGRSDEAKARIYSTELSADGLKRADKLSEDSFEAEREIESLRADAYEALRQLPSYQRMRDSEKASARQQIDEQLKSFRARAESTRRNKKTGRVSVVREKAAQLPDYEPLALARAAVLSAQQ